ncbi:MAG TPA: anti-sigma factor [Nitrospira sp.]|nr:anti-sigma factor [Nitrospira sp.]
MTHEELEEAVPLYAAGALDRAERQALEAHLLSGCQSCHHALKEYQSVASLLSFGLSPMQAPRALKAKIMAARNPDPLAIDSNVKEVARPSLEPGEWMNHLFPPIVPARSFSLPWVIGFATLLVVGLGGYLAWTYTTRVSHDASKIRLLEASLQEQSMKLATLERDISLRDRTLAELQVDAQQKANDAIELKNQLIEREVELEAARAQLTAAVRGKVPQDELATLLRQPDAKVVTLAGSDIAKRASAVLLFNPTTQKVWLYSANLPECPRGTAYQLWAIDQKPVSGGTFHMDAGETANLLVKRLPEFEKAKKFAVSLEPAGGRPQPSGPIYLFGQTS